VEGAGGGGGVFEGVGFYRRKRWERRQGGGREFNRREQREQRWDRRRECSRR
jgi:hypothetical protein